VRSRVRSMTVRKLGDGLLVALLVLGDHAQRR
jgi:hypothetical protein